MVQYTPSYVTGFEQYVGGELGISIDQGYEAISFDLVTPAGNAAYQFAHMGLPYVRLVPKNYPSGHMLYLDESGSAQFAKDLHEFVTSALK